MASNTRACLRTYLLCHGVMSWLDESPTDSAPLAPAMNKAHGPRKGCRNTGDSVESWRK